MDIHYDLCTNGPIAHLNILMKIDKILISEWTRFWFPSYLLLFAMLYIDVYLNDLVACNDKIRLKMVKRSS